ncbi:MAG: hypothetical protein ACLQBY_09300 [Solirubrobacteraceae bacterium]
MASPTTTKQTHVIDSVDQLHAMSSNVRPAPVECAPKSLPVQLRRRARQWP